MSLGTTLRERWRHLEDRAIDRGEFFQMSAAGKTLEDALAPLIHQYARGNVLDAGAGRLAHRPYVLQNPAVSRYVSIDCSQSHSQLNAVADVLGRLPFPEDTFDCVLCSQVLEHVPEPALALDEVARVLRPGGVALLSVPHLSFVHGAPEDYYRYTRFGLAHLIQRAGLVPVTVTAAGGLLSLLSTPASMGLLLAADSDLSPCSLQWAGRWTNKGLIAATGWLDGRLDRDRIFALNVVAVARKPQVPEKDARAWTGLGPVGGQS